MLDLLIKNGTVVDGTGAPAKSANIGVTDGRISYVGDDQPAAEKEIDASGKHITPGFIDVHTHYDAQVTWDPSCNPQTKHGFTTILIGNCGFSLAPLTPKTAKYLVPMLAKVEAIPPETLEEGVNVNWTTMKEYLDNLEGKVVANMGVGTGHSALRTYVMGERAHTDQATEEDLEDMKSILRESLEAGSISFSSSHAETHRDHLGDPVPSLIAGKEELLELAAEVKNYEGTHLGFVSSIGEMTDGKKQLITDLSLAAQRTVNWPLLVPTQLPPELEEMKLTTADFAREQGAEVRVQCSSQPQDARINLRNGLGYDTFPGIFSELYHLSVEKRIERMKEPETREAMREVLTEQAGLNLPISILAQIELFTVYAVVHPENRKYLARKVADIAEEEGKSVLDALLDIAIKDELKTTFLMANYPADTKEGWEKLADAIADDRTIWGATDGGAHLDVLCQYSHATQFLAKAVREHNLMSMEQAINLFTKVPAEFVGIKDRGVICEGAYADLLVIDFDRLAAGELETREDLPANGIRLYSDAQGYDYIFVNGQAIVENDEYTGAEPGTVLRSGRDTYTVEIPAAMAS